ncbi:MAG: hypothetical protein HYU34_05910 [Candidatus Omnitrophica bacterium]|nr:hypothetical protein [Candidatus Omnitrophota bacterium]
MILKKIFLLLPAVFLAILLFSFQRLARHPEFLEESLVTGLEEKLGADLSLGETKLVFTPFPELHAREVRLESATDAFPPVTAGKVKFSFQGLPLLWGRVRLSGFRMENATGHLWKIPVEKVDFKIQGLSPNGWAPFEWKGALRGGEAGGLQALQGKGSLRFKNPSGNGIRDFGLKMEASLLHFSLAELAEGGTLKYFPKGFSGELEVKLRVEKERGANVLRGEIKLLAEGLKIGATSGLSLTGNGSLLWDLKNHSFELQQVSLESPFGRLDGRSLFNVETGEIGEVRLTGRKIVLEELVRNFPKLFEALPVEFGFSGLSDFDVSLRGTLEYLGLHGNFNFTPAVLTFGRVFSKPKDFPLGVHFDFLLKKGNLLGGDFSLRIRQTTVKGSLVDVDFKTGEGELTLITNKFDLEGWNQLVIPFSGCTLQGAAKVLVNWKGNLTDLNRAQKMLNLTLEDVTLLSPSGRGLRNAHLYLDTSPLSFQLRDTRFEVKNSPVEMEAEITTPAETPKPTVTLRSSHLEIFSLVEEIRELATLLKVPPVWLQKVSSTETLLKGFLPASTVLEDFELKIRPGPDKLLLENLEFRAFDGTFKFHGERDWPSENPNFWFEVNSDRVRLARYFEEQDPKGKIFEGNLFFNGRFQGTGRTLAEISTILSGQGSVSITNGEWFGLDLAKPLGALRAREGKTLFQDFSNRTSGSTPFSDLTSRWTYGQGKFETKDNIINTGDFWVEGEGNLALDRTLNARLSLYLSDPETRRFLKSWGPTVMSDGKLLGPLPLLLVGSLSQPEVRTDETLLGPFLEAVDSRRFRKILREP